MRTSTAVVTCIIMLWTLLVTWNIILCYFKLNFINGNISRLFNVICFCVNLLPLKLIYTGQRIVQKYRTKESNVWKQVRYLVLISHQPATISEVKTVLPSLKPPDAYAYSNRIKMLLEQKRMGHSVLIRGFFLGGGFVFCCFCFF